MTALKCKRCQKYWSMNTNSPDLFEVISRFCPDCVPAIAPRMGVLPFPKGRSA